MSEWISVDERLPDKLEDVLVWRTSSPNGKYHAAVDYLYSTEEVRWSDYYDVTHWMPLPEPPNE